MSDISGVDWWFRNRDYVLRESVESLQQEAASAHRSASRLSSRLRKLQGSMESRLDALSAAFDAYVELDDVRQQLNAYGDAAAIRRDCMQAIAAAGEGRQVRPVDPRNTDYWIAWGTTAMIDRAAGQPDLDLEERLRAAVPEAELFLVAGAALLGGGAGVGDRVRALIIPQQGDAMDQTQTALWHAVLGGLFDRPGEQVVLSGLLDAFAGRLREDDPADWWGWIVGEARGGGSVALDWLEQAVAGASRSGPVGPADGEPERSGPEFAPPDGPAQRDPATVNAFAERKLATMAERGEDELRTIVLEMIEAGHGQERELLQRARELRARIENPDRTGGVPDDGPAPSGASAFPTPIVVAVREAWLNDVDGSPESRTIFGRIAPTLAAATEHGVVTLEPNPVSDVIRMPGGRVTIGPDGPDPDELAAARNRPSVPTQTTGDKATMYVGAGIAAVAAVIALIGGIAGSAEVAIGFVLVLLVAGGAALRKVYQRRQQQASGDEDHQRAEERLAQATERVRARAEVEAEVAQRSREQLSRVQQLLTGAAVRR